MTGETETKAKRKHPVPWICWVWPIGGLVLLLISGLLFLLYSHRYDPPLLSPPADAEVKPLPPPDSADWGAVLMMACVGLFTGIAYWWLWYRLAIKRVLNRTTWHLGIGLILTGVAFLFFTNFLVPAIAFLVVLAVWAQGFTRQHFDKL